MSRRAGTATIHDTQSGSSRYGFPVGGVFNAALDGVIVMDADGIIRDWNPAAQQIFGFTREAALGRELAELIIPGALREAHRSALRRYMETRQPVLLDRRIELSALRRGGIEFPVELTITRIGDQEPPLFAGFMRDLGELDEIRRHNARLQQRMAFLARAGLVLEGSLNVDETLHRLAELTVPDLSELTVIDLLGEDRSIRMSVAVSAASALASELEEIRRREPLRLTGGHPVAQVLRSGEPLLLESISEELGEKIAQGPSHQQLVQELGYRSAVVVPLIARGRVLGALSLLRMKDPDPYGRDDLVLVEELARRASLAVDNARLFGAMRHLAKTLQDSLLPRSIPDIRGVRITGHYLAAAQGQEVGGDFYDVFPIGESSWGIAIGDVCGKGAEAAALTSLARYTIRALAGREPGTVLHLLNEAVLRNPDILTERFLTVLFAIARWESGVLVLEVASGGHPAPLVRKLGGEVERVSAAGPLIGMTETVTFETRRVELEPGDALILYTDGLTDARAPSRILSETDVAALLRQASGLGGEELARFLQHSATGGQDPRDDIALLILELEDDQAVLSSQRAQASESRH